MSEAADAEREVEDFFNEQVFGAVAAPEQDAPFPVEAPPEPKSISEAIALAEDGQEEGTPEAEVAAIPVEEAVETEMDPDLIPEAEEEEEPYVAWARKQYGEDLDLNNPDVAKLAKAGFEKEKLLGKKSEEAKILQQEREARELQEQIDALNEPGNLTPEEDSWVDEAVMSADPSAWARNALEQGRPDLYASVLDRWSTLGPQEARQARILHGNVLQIIQSQPSPTESYTQALGRTFLDLGLNLETHGAVILQKVEELGANHPDVQGMMSQDPDMRRMATRHIYDLVAQGRTTVAKARTEDVVAKRVQEETLRQKAAGIEQGGPRVETPKRSAFWDGFDEELSERGWDGNRPTYGRG